MRVVGYVKEKKENSFTKPVYSSKEHEYFFHTLDDAYNIVDFVKTELTEHTFKKLYLSKNFESGTKGAIVFVGKERYIKYDSADNAIDEVINYINDTITVAEAKKILTEAKRLKSSIISDQFNTTTFEENSDSQEEQIILTFDLPLPTKDTLSKVPLKKEANTNSKQGKLKQTTNTGHASILEYLTQAGMNVELTLKLRANERRIKLKPLNYEFKLANNTQKNSNS